jgi:hypothetical protein
VGKASVTSWRVVVLSLSCLRLRERREIREVSALEEGEERWPSMDLRIWVSVRAGERGWDLRVLSLEDGTIII